VAIIRYFCSLIQLITYLVSAYKYIVVIIRSNFNRPSQFVSCAEIIIWRETELPFYDAPPSGHYSEVSVVVNCRYCLRNGSF